MIVPVQQGQHLGKHALYLVEGLFIALKMNICSTGGDMGIRKCILDLPKVDVVKAEQQQRIGAFDAQLFFGQRVYGVG